MPAVIFRIIRAVRRYGSAAVRWVRRNWRRIMRWLGNGWTVAEVIQYIANLFG